MEMYSFRMASFDLLYRKAGNLLEEQLDSLIDSMKEHWEAVIAAQGGFTRF